MTVINTNVNALYAQNALSVNSKKLTSAMESLSTGKRVNSAADDPAGMGIITIMNQQVSGLKMATQNASDATNLIQTAEGATASISDMLQRMRQLAVQASSDTNDNNQRSYLDLEFQQLKQEIVSVASTTLWNGFPILTGSAGQAVGGAKSTITAQTSAPFVSGQTAPYGNVLAANAMTINGVPIGPSNLSAVTGGLVSGSPLLAGDLTLNGYQVPPSGNSGISNVLGTSPLSTIASNIPTVPTTSGITIDGTDIGFISAGTSPAQLAIQINQKLGAAAGATYGKNITATISNSGYLVLTDSANATITVAGGNTAGIKALFGSTAPTAAATITGTAAPALSASISNVTSGITIDGTDIGFIPAGSTPAQLASQINQKLGVAADAAHGLNVTASISNGCLVLTDSVTSATVTVAGANFAGITALFGTASPTAAHTVTGSSAPVLNLSISNATSGIAVDGTDIGFVSAGTTPSQLVSQINNALHSSGASAGAKNVTASLDATNHLLLTDSTNANVVIAGATNVGVLGLTAGTFVSSSCDQSGSAFAIAAAINSISTSTNVTAVAQPVTTTLTAAGTTALTSGQLTINGVSIQTSAHTNATEEGADLRTAITAAQIPGITVSGTGSSVILTSNDGRNIVINANTAQAQTALGLSGAVTSVHSNVVLSTNSTTGINVGLNDVNSSVSSGFTVPGYDTVSPPGGIVATSNPAASAISIASAINAKEASTGVKAIANPVVTMGNSLDTTFISPNGESVYINGKQVSIPAGTFLATNNSQQRQSAILSALNTQSTATGVTATPSQGGGVTLTAVDGRNVSIWFDSGVSGLSAGTFGMNANDVKGINPVTSPNGQTTLYGTVTLASATPNAPTPMGPGSIVVGGSADAVSQANFSSLGLVAGSYGGSNTDRVGRLSFQVGAEANQTISIDLPDFGPDGSITGPITSDANAGTPTVGISTSNGAQNVLSQLDKVMNNVNAASSRMGAIINRLSYTISNIANVSSNTTQSLSAIQDTDYAAASTALSTAQIVQQAATAVLAQANTSQQSVLKLLQGG